MTYPVATKSEASDIALTSTIVAAYVANNPVPRPDLAALILDVHATVEKLRLGGSGTADNRPSPAVPVKRSVTPEYIVCLEDGKKFKSLKRHLATQYGMTPDEYRARWDLSPTYPMVAPTYAATRSALAKSMGLGRKKA